MSEAKKDRKKRIKPHYILIGALLLAILVYVVLQFFVLNVNRSAKRTAKAAFLAACKDINYDNFVKATIYSDKCQKYLCMEISGDLSQIKANFELMQGEKDGYTLNLGDIREYTYKPGEEQFDIGVGFLKAQNPEVFTEDIDRVAVVEMEYKISYNDGTPAESGTETYWCYRVGKLWYAHPLATEVRD